jgi:hypothetical protein
VSTSSLKSFRQPIEYYSDRWPTDSPASIRGNVLNVASTFNRAWVDTLTLHAVFSHPSFVERCSDLIAQDGAPFATETLLPKARL